MTSLLITNDFPPIVSGLSTYFYQLWRHLPQDKIMVLAPKIKHSAEIDRKIKFTIIRKWIPSGESYFAKIIKMIVNCWWGLWFVKKYKISKLHCGQIISNGLCGLICNKLLGLPYSIYVCGSESIRFRKHQILSYILDTIL